MPAGAAAPTPAPTVRPLTPKSARVAADYLRKILSARVYDVARESPLQPARSLSRRLGNHVLLKREDQQPVFSFKLRGAYNKMAHLPPEQLKKGVICASAGNHAQGVALGARKLGCRAVIVMPVTTPRVKVDAVQCAGRRGGAARRQLFRRLCARGRTAEDRGPDLRAPLRRPRRHRRPGHGGHGDPAPAPGPAGRGVRGHRRRRADLRRGGLHQGGAPEVKVIGVQTTDSDAMLRR
jgi:threonine dehydratase